jgi:prepilin-type N-terminal cleavage/methylation domain-containing protein
MKIRNAFTMIELVFVIVVMGIVGKFGVEFLVQAYRNFIFSNVSNTLQANSEIAIEFIANRLQYRIKDSTIARDTAGAFVPLANAAGGSYIVLEWIGSDIEGFRGDSLPYWSGVLDLNAGNAAALVSRATDTGSINALIDILSDGDSSINDAALYFIGSNNDINGYGWGGALTDQSSVMHPINSNLVATQFVSRPATAADFTGVDIYEYYKLAWTAYAVAMENYDNATKMGDLVFYYDYQPWNGESYLANGKKATIMENVSTFQFRAIGSVAKIQVCVKSNLVEEYSICKEKTIF